MQAWIINQFGPPEVFERQELAIPVCRDEEVLVKIKAIGINPVDYKIRSGSLKVLKKKQLPRILGYDMAGIVEKAGSRIEMYKPGDEVYGMLPFKRGGGYAEYTAIKAGFIAYKPLNVSFEEAAACPLAALTALQAWRDLGRLQPGHKVLINGCSGEVGTFAIQLARLWGADITAACCPSHTDLVKNLGADKTIDLGAQHVLADPEKYHIFFDIIASLSFGQVKHMLYPRGAYITPHLSVNDFIYSLFSIKKYRFSQVKCHNLDLTYLKKVIEEGLIRVMLDKIYSFTDLPEAHRHIENQQNKGKVVISLI